MSDGQILTILSLKLDGFANVLQLSPYDQHGQFQGHLKPISHALIQPIHIICPSAVVCETVSCNPRSLLQATKKKNIPKVTLIKGLSMLENVHVLTGRCPDCQTIYSADHEHETDKEQNRNSRVYLNFARHLKVGQNLWVDQEFSNAVLNGMYSFHASAAAYTEYWNNSFWRRH
jgi:hypothetical protein